MMEQNFISSTLSLGPSLFAPCLFLQNAKIFQKSDNAMGNNLNCFGKMQK